MELTAEILKPKKLGKQKKKEVVLTKEKAIEYLVTTIFNKNHS